MIAELISRVCSDFGNHLIAPRADDAVLLSECDRLTHSPAADQLALCQFIATHAPMCIAQARVEKQDRDALKAAQVAPVVPNAPSFWEDQ